MPGVHTVGVGVTTPVPAAPVDTPEPAATSRITRAARPRRAGVGPRRTGGPRCRGNTADLSCTANDERGSKEDHYPLLPLHGAHLEGAECSLRV